MHEHGVCVRREKTTEPEVCHSLSSNKAMTGEADCPPVTISQMQLPLTPSALMECPHLSFTLAGMLLIWRGCGYHAESIQCNIQSCFLCAKHNVTPLHSHARKINRCSTCMREFILRLNELKYKITFMYASLSN